MEIFYEDQKWSSLPSLPGTPRIAHGVTLRAKYMCLVVLGRTLLSEALQHFARSINWALDVETVKWNRVADTPL